MQPEVSLLDFALCLTEVSDLIEPSVAYHHRRTAYAAWRIGEQMALEPGALSRLVLAAAVHDIGMLSLEEQMRALRFDVEHVEHAEPGYMLLSMFPPFARIARIVRFHHVEWCDGEGAAFRGDAVPLESHVLYLADRIAVLVDDLEPPLIRSAMIRTAIEEGSGRRFLPEAVEAFFEVAEQDSFWLDLWWPPEGEAGFGQMEHMCVTPGDLRDFAQMLARIVDFRSRFTATHSMTVAASASTLAGLCGMSREYCADMWISGCLHDIGKLAVPTEFVECPGQLGPREWAAMHTHPYYTKRVLSAVPGGERIAAWAAHHHERLDGRGYPYRLDASSLDLGSRIVAVADIDAALGESRPYRAPLCREDRMRHLHVLATQGSIDADVVQAFADGCDVIEDAQVANQALRMAEFECFDRAE